MKKFKVKFWEKFADTYEVEAESYEEAVEMLRRDIELGNLEEPTSFDEEGFENLT